MIEFDIFELATTAVIRNNLATIVDAGINVVEPKDPNVPVSATVVIKISFTEPHDDRDYLCVLEVLGPDEQVRVSKDIKLSIHRPPEANLALPFTATVAPTLSFVPGVFGVFTVKFYLAGEATREIKLLVRPHAHR